MPAPRNSLPSTTALPGTAPGEEAANSGTTDPGASLAAPPPEIDPLTHAALAEACDQTDEARRKRLATMQSKISATLANAEAATAANAGGASTAPTAHGGAGTGDPVRLSQRRADERAAQ